MNLQLLPNGCVKYVDSSQNSPVFRFKTRKGMRLLTNTTVCNSGASAAWTMVYDEGFEVRFKGMKLFTFSYYYPNGEKFKSNCSKTCTGWYQSNKNGKVEYGCFRGEMVDRDEGKNYINDQTEQLNVVQGVVESKDSQENKKFMFKAKRNMRFKSLNRNKFKETLHLSGKFKEHFKVVERINSLENNLWTAGINERFAGFSIAEMNKMAGRRQKMVFDDNSQVKSKKFVKKTIKEDVSDLPASFSWEKFLSEPGEQGSCGSCYAISTLKMLEARLRIHEHINVKLSTKWAVGCSYYNQGCEGGYSFLLGRFGEENYLVEDNCTVTHGEQGVCRFECKGNEERMFKIKDYWYIGGSYGECNERRIMMEIMKNGPVVLSFEPDYTFMLYKKGIYHKPGLKNWMNQNEQKPEWFKVDHSVVCYGWGEENGEKYWLLMNSWGKQWGQDGKFKMKRGEDELGIEFIGEAAMPYLVKN